MVDILPAVARACLALLVAVAAAGAAVAGPETHALTISSARIDVADGVSTVRLAIDGPVEAETFALDAPPRIIVDLPEVRWRLSAPPPLGVVAGLRYGLAAPGRARLVIDLAEPALPRRVLAGTGEGSAGLRLELVPVAAGTFAAAAGWPRGEGPLSPRRTAPVIVIDPGHGGRDPGAVVGDLREKDVTLAFSLALAEALGAAGFDPVLTRSEDRFVSIADRVATARRVGGAAFLSIHADAVPQTSVSGVSVYTLGREPTDRLAAALAEQAESGERLALGAPPQGRDVAEALSRLVLRETMAESARLGPALVAAMAEEVPVLRTNPLRAAAFRVLEAPDVPSALIELGFMSSAKDRERLTDPDWQAAAIRGIVQGLAEWFGDSRTAACAGGACIPAD